MGRNRTARIAALALMLATAVVTPGLAQEPSGPPPSPGNLPSGGAAPEVFDVAPGVTAEALAFPAGSSTPVLYRLRLGAGTTYRFESDPSIALAVVESGPVTITSDAALTVVDPAAGEEPAARAAGSPSEVPTGARILLPEGASGELTAGGGSDVSLVVASVPTAMLQTEASPDPAASPAAGIVGAATGGSGSCVLEYQRADTMWAPYGSPDGILGTEIIRLAPGERKVFVTDWAYEKKRNNGSTYYGSHLRRTLNPGERAVVVRVKEYSTYTYRWTLGPSTWNKWQADLMEVSCPL